MEGTLSPLGSRGVGTRPWRRSPLPAPCICASTGTFPFCTGPNCLPLFRCSPVCGSSRCGCFAYNILWRYAALREALAGVGGVAFASVILFAVNMTTSVMTLPRSVFAIEALIFAFAAGRPGSACAGAGRGCKGPTASATNGCSSSARATRVSCWSRIRAAAAPGRARGRFGGRRRHENQPDHGRRPGTGPAAEIPDIVKRHAVERIIIAMPSAGADVLRETMAICRDTDAELKTLPPVGELVAGRVRAQDVRDVRIEDLLRREPVATDLSAISGYLHGKRVLVTGAGGSIGSELCRQVCTFEPAQLVLLDHSENAVFEIDAELRERFPRVSLAPVIGDVRSRTKMEQVCAVYRPQSRVPRGGAQTCSAYGSESGRSHRQQRSGHAQRSRGRGPLRRERFVMVSTDKAVNPGNVMGATKRLAELVVQGMQAAQGGQGSAAAGPSETPGGTRFVSVRFGNVLGCRGSVIPLFREQIDAGRTGHGDAPRHDALFHDDSRGGAARPPGRRPWAAAARCSCSTWASRCASSTWPTT